MALFNPDTVYIERGSEEYPVGRSLIAQYEAQGKEMIWVGDHNSIPETRAIPDAELVRKKRTLVIGIRKSVRLIPNTRSADYIVPFTSSGCPALCTYCYLTCTFFSNSYLRVFVNREDMWNAIVRKVDQSQSVLTFEIGSNSDLVLEDSLTGNLRWAIERFSFLPRGKATFATKFAQVDRLLGIDHRGKTQARISVNPKRLVRKVEIGTAPLEQRINAANRLWRAGYRVGINVAPVILGERWRNEYTELFDELEAGLDDGLQKQVFFEVIFMTYGLANRKINAEAIPQAMDVFDAELMKPKGRSKYCYKAAPRQEAETFIRDQIQTRFPAAIISYIC